MNWADAPAGEGLYWVCCDGPVDILNVYRLNGRLVYDEFGKDYYLDVSVLSNYKWLGPITPPQPPEGSR